MWIKASGELTENVQHLCTSVSTHLFISGDRAAIVDASISAMHTQLEEAITAAYGTLDFVLLTHAQFDHVGAIPYLRKFAPQLEVVAGPHTAELLQDETVLNHLYQRNKEAAEALSIPFELDPKDWKAALQVNKIMGDGDVLLLGEGVEIKLIATPGHTADSTSYFIKPDGALACGETVGAYGGRDRITSCFTDNFDAYVKSLQRLSGLEVHVLGFPHCGVLTGDLVGKYFQEAQVDAERFRLQVKERVEQGELLDEIYLSMLPEWEAEGRYPEGPFVEEQIETLRLMVRAAAEGKPEENQS